MLGRKFPHGGRCFEVAAAVILLFLCIQARAQEQKLQHRPYVDTRKFHYGFLIGIHQESLRLENNGYIDPETGDQWFASNNRFDLGLTVGILGEWRLSTYFALRMSPTLHFANKHVTYRNQTTSEHETQEIKSTYVSLPIDVKFSAPRWNNHRPYLLAGVNFAYDLNGGKDTGNLRLKRYRAYIELGFGCDFYLPFFKLIPELKFCLGLNDVLQTDRPELSGQSNEIFTKSVDKATNNLIVLTLNFE